MTKLALFGFTPREEVIVATTRRDTPEAEIALFSGIPNKALEERVNHVHGTADEDIRYLKEWNPDSVIIGPDKFSINGVQERLRAEGIHAVGADREQIRIESDRSYLRTTFSELSRYFPPYEIFNSWDEAAVRSCLRNFREYVVKYNGVYEQIGGGSKLSGLHLKSEEEALDFARKSIEECGSVVIEKQIAGTDFSVNAISAHDGSIFFFPENYCYKLRNTDNQGPNTSGTGSFAHAARLPFMTARHQTQARDICAEIVSRVNHKGVNPLVSGLNLDFRLGDDGQVYLFEMNTRFAGAGTLSTMMDLTANPMSELVDCALRGSFNRESLIGRANASVGVFTYPQFFPGASSSEVRAQIPKAIAVPDGVNCYTGWVQVVSETALHREVILQNSTTQLFQTIGVDSAACRERIYPLLKGMSPVLEYREDIGDLSKSFLRGPQ